MSIQPSIQQTTGVNGIDAIATSLARALTTAITESLATTILANAKATIEDRSTGLTSSTSSDTKTEVVPKILKTYPRAGKRVTLVSPNGDIYQTNNMTEFAKEFKLNQTTLSKLNSGQAKSHKGWKAARKVAR